MAPLFLILSAAFFSAAMKSPAPQLARSKNPLMVERESLVDNTKVTVAGRLRLVGSEPFTSYVITPETNFDIFIDEDSVGGRQNIAKLQYKIVRASGIIRVQPLRKDDSGKVLVNRYTLIVNDIGEYKK